MLFRSPPADWAGINQPSCGCIHEGRFWGFGNLNSPHMGYYSTTADHEDVSGGGILSIYPGVGERIVAAFSFKKGIVVFKYPIGIYYIDTSNISAANWKVQQVSSKLGCAWIGTAEPIEDDIVYLDASRAIRLLTTTDKFSDVSTQALSDINEMGPFIRDNLNFNSVRTWQMHYYTTKRELHIACTGLGATTNNSRLVVDFSDLKAGPKWRFSTRDAPISLWSRIVSGMPELMLGDNNGQVWRMDQETRSHNGSGYNGQFKSPPLDLSHVEPRLATVRKNGSFLELVVEPKGNWNLSVDIEWDGELRQTLQYNMGTTGASLGSFVLGTDKLAQTSVLNKKKRLVGSGRRLTLIGRNSGDGQDFSEIGRAHV